jgi:GNAT superfamily N-acetyltransferase
VSAGLTIRDAGLGDADAIAEIQVQGWTTAYASFLPNRLPASYSVDVRRAEWTGRLQAPAPGTVHLIAFEDGDAVGICSGGPPLRDEAIVEGDTDAYTAQVYGLYVAPARYGAGIGRRLLGSLAGRLRDLGHGSLCLWAFELNPYRRFYDRLGGRIVARAFWHLGDVAIAELAYGGPGIGAVIEACSTEGKTE